MLKVNKKLFIRKIKLDENKTKLLKKRQKYFLNKKPEFEIFELINFYFELIPFSSDELLNYQLDNE
jgi:hypothetical protein